MGINNKQRRKEKKRKKLIQHKKKIHKREKKSPYPSFEMNSFPDLSLEERKLFIDEMQSHSEKLYSESLNKIISILSEYDPLTLLSMLSNYGLTVGIGDKGLAPSYKNGKVQQTHVEIAQAILLTLDNHKNYKPPTPDIYQTFQDAIIDLALAFAFVRQKSEILDLSDKQLSITQVQEIVRSHTQMVRNWGHYSQVKNISTEMYSYFDEHVTKTYGFSATDTIKFFDTLMRSLEEKINERFGTLKRLFRLNEIERIVHEYHKLINDDKADKFMQFIKEHKLKKQDVIAMILSHYDLRIADNYIFHVDDISYIMAISSPSIRAILDEFSYDFGALKAKPIEHIYLDNPIWTKPVIRLDDDHFYCPMPQLFFSFVLKCLDDLIERIDKPLLSKKKSIYLENKIEEIVKRRFPEANTVKNIKWKDGSTEYETDLITAIDSYLLIVEAKSGKIDPTALRGAPKKLERDVNKLLIEPNIQSKRLQNKLFHLIENPEEDDQLRQKLPFDLNTSKKVLRLSITFEFFATLQNNMKKLEKTEWIPSSFEYCPTMTLADFEKIFDVLEHPVEIINYLEKREYVESSIDYMGDELDLLGYYIDYHLNFPVTDENHSFVISGMSHPIDNYYDSKDAGLTLPKPTVKMNKLFQSILRQLETRKTYRWTEIGSVLYSFLPDDQDKLASYIYKIKKNVKSHWMKDGHENTIVYIPPLNTEYALCYIAFNEKNKDQRYNFAENASAEAFEKEHVRYCLVVGKNIDDANAYSMIALYEPTSNKSEEPIKNPQAAF